MTIRQVDYYRALYWGLLLFSFSLSLSKSMSTVSLLLVCLAAVFLSVSSREFRAGLALNRKQPLTLSLALMIFVAVVGLLFTQNLSDGIRIVHKLSDILLIYLAVSVLLQATGDHEEVSGNAERLLLSFVLGLAVLDVIGLMTFVGLIGGKKFVLPLAPLHVHHIWFANINAIGIYVAFSFLLFPPKSTSRRMRNMLILFVLVGAVCILLSTSRTAWLGMLASVLALLFILIKNRKILFITVAALVAACVLIYASNAIVHERINQISSELRQLSSSADTSIGNRFLMWKAAYSMFLSNPLFGVGTGDFVPVLREYIRTGVYPTFLLEYNQPHNMYLFALATNGLIGLAALVFLFYKVLSGSGRMLKGRGEFRFYGFLALAVTVHFMVAGMTDSLFNIQILRYAYAFIIGICMRQSLQETNKGFTE